MYFGKLNFKITKLYLLKEKYKQHYIENQNCLFNPAVVGLFDPKEDVIVNCVFI